MLLRSYRVKCDGCGKEGPTAATEHDAYALSTAMAPNLFKHREGVELQDLCWTCRQRIPRQERIPLHAEAR